MTTQSTQVCTPCYRLLSAGQIDRIHAATLELLDTVGVNIRHQGARDMMAAAGCTVRNDGTVFIYKIPVWGTAGVTDANCLDLQAGMEWGDSLLLNAMAGVNLIHDVGYMGQGLVGHPAALVACDEIISYTKRFMRGFELDDDHFDLDTICQVGAGGSFLSTRQTARLLRSEHWYPNLCNRDAVGSWQEKGSKDMADRAVEKARDILHRPATEALSESVQNELIRIRFHAEKHIKDVKSTT